MKEIGGPGIFEIVEGIPLLDRGGGLGGHYEQLHADGGDPWRYDHRWIERQRHRLALRSIRQLLARHGPSASVLEIGPSLGHLTVGMLPHCAQLIVVDVSLSALAATARRVAKEGGAEGRFLPVAASADDLPFAPGAFDLVLALDGPMSWFPERDRRQRCIAELWRGVAPGGVLFVSDYLIPVQLPQWLGELRAGTSAQVIHAGLADRLYYKGEQYLGARACAALLSNPIAGHLLAAGARCLGMRGSNHFTAEIRRPPRKPA